MRLDGHEGWPWQTTGQGRKGCEIAECEEAVAYYKDIGDGKRTGCLKKGRLPGAESMQSREDEPDMVTGAACWERRKRMVCKSCQLVEMARVARQGEVDVYPMPEMRAGRTGARETGREIEVGGRRQGPGGESVSRQAFVG